MWSTRSWRGVAWRGVAWQEHLSPYRRPLRNLHLVAAGEGVVDPYPLFEYCFTLC